MRSENAKASEMILKVNEKEVCYPNQVSLDAVIDDLDYSDTFVLVFLNGRIMVNRDWSKIWLKGGDEVYVSQVWITGG